LNAIDNILQAFEPVALADTDRVRLADRRDTKYIFHLSQLPFLLGQLQAHYSILDINHRRTAAYETLYYDTPDLQMYRSHHNGQLSRYKIRHRTYRDSGVGFLEVKFRNNKGRTIKSRMAEAAALPAWHGPAADFLSGHAPYAPGNLVPSARVNYSRITLVSTTAVERLTFDLGLQFIKGHTCLRQDQLVIAELKQEKALRSPFTDVMKQLRIGEASISKYCIAVASTHREIKKNHFKDILSSIQNISNHDTIANC
jgi:VTC domain